MFSSVASIAICIQERIGHLFISTICPTHCYSSYSNSQMTAGVSTRLSHTRKIFKNRLAFGMVPRYGSCMVYSLCLCVRMGACDGCMGMQYEDKQRQHDDDDDDESNIADTMCIRLYRHVQPNSTPIVQSTFSQRLGRVYNEESLCVRAPFRPFVPLFFVRLIRCVV